MTNDRKEYFRELRKDLKKILSKSRMEHVLGVEYTAAALAMRYGADIEKAEFAGLMHDYAKCLSGEEQLEQCLKLKINMTDVEKKSPDNLLHGKLGAYYCRTKYHIKDEEILSAIAWHTTGKPAMTLLEKIVFVADYIEPRRDKAQNLSYIRRLAFIDIDEAVYQITKDTLRYLNGETAKKEGSSSIDQTTLETYEYYRLIHESKNSLNHNN